MMPFKAVDSKPSIANGYGTVLFAQKTTEVVMVKHIGIGCISWTMLIYALPMVAAYTNVWTPSEIIVAISENAGRLTSSVAYYHNRRKTQFCFV